MRKKIITIVLTSLFIMICALEASAGWYDCKVVKIITQSDGDTIIQIVPGDIEPTYFELSRIQISQANIGSNKNMAIVLTAVSMGYELRISLNDVPSYQKVQEVNSIGFTVPNMVP